MSISQAMSPCVFNIFSGVKKQTFLPLQIEQVLPPFAFFRLSLLFSILGRWRPDFCCLPGTGQENCRCPFCPLEGGFLEHVGYWLRKSGIPVLALCPPFGPGGGGVCIFRHSPLKPGILQKYHAWPRFDRVNGKRQGVLF